MKESIARAEYLSAVTIYGTIGMILRFIDLPSEIVVMCRGLIGTVFILGVIWLRGKRPDWQAIRRNLKWLLISGACLGFNWVFLFLGYRHTTVAIASLCNYIAPVIVLFLSPLLYRERMTVRAVLCVIAAVAGVVLNSGVLMGSANDVSLPGVGFGLLAAAGFVGLVLCNKKLEGIGAYDKSFVQLFASAVTVLPYVLVMNLGKPLILDARSVWLTLMLGVVHTGVAYILYFDPLKYLPVRSVALIGYMEPVVATLLSVIVLREPMTWMGALGAVLIIGAAIVGELVPARTNAR